MLLNKRMRAQTLLVGFECYKLCMTCTAQTANLDQLNESD